MACTTTCQDCGKCYEETSEEAANSPDGRRCLDCYRKMANLGDLCLICKKNPNGCPYALVLCKLCAEKVISPQELYVRKLEERVRELERDHKRAQFFSDEFWDESVATIVERMGDVIWVKHVKYQVDLERKNEELANRVQELEKLLAGK